MFLVYNNKLKDTNKNDFQLNRSLFKALLKSADGIDMNASDMGSKKEGK